MAELVRDDRRRRCRGRRAARRTWSRGPTSARAYAQPVRVRGRYTSRCLPGPWPNLTLAATSFHSAAELAQPAVVRTASTVSTTPIRTAPSVCADQKSATSWFTRSATWAAVVPSGVEPAGRTVTTVTWLVRRPVGTGGVGGAFSTTVESRTGRAGWSPASPVVSPPSSHRCCRRRSRRRSSRPRRRRPRRCRRARSRRPPSGCSSAGRRPRPRPSSRRARSRPTSAAAAPRRWSPSPCSSAPRPRRPPWRGAEPRRPWPRPHRRAAGSGGRRERAFLGAGIPL